MGESQMLRELLSIFQAKDPLSEMTGNFSEMLNISRQLVGKAGDLYFAHRCSPEERDLLRQEDVRVNKLQRRIRKQVIFHLSLAKNSPDLPYCLLLMSLVKDVERIGDYAKELADLVSLASDPGPDNVVRAELNEIRGGIETDFAGAVAVFETADRERAIELINCGKDTVERCSQLTGRLARSDYDAGTVTNLALGAQFYSRIAGHMLNLLSGVVMPLHRLDYYDEKDIARAEKEQSLNDLKDTGDEPEDEL